MSFFSNKAVNLINLHHAIKRFSMGIADIFVAAYLLSLGLSLIEVFCVYIGIFILRFCLRPISFIRINKIGLRKSVILGTIFYAGCYPILTQVDGIGFWLLTYIFYYAIADTLYWLPFHAYYSAIGDNDHRGKHVAVREALSALGNGAAPALGGFLIANFGFIYAASAASTVAIFSSINIQPRPKKP